MTDFSASVLTVNAQIDRRCRKNGDFFRIAAIFHDKHYWLDAVGYLGSDWREILPIFREVATIDQNCFRVNNAVMRHTCMRSCVALKFNPSFPQESGGPVKIGFAFERKGELSTQCPGIYLFAYYPLW
jgi:hypothetical protein